MGTGPRLRFRHLALLAVGGMALAGSLAVAPDTAMANSTTYERHHISVNASYPGGGHLSHWHAYAPQYDFTASTLANVCQNYPPEIRNNLGDHGLLGLHPTVVDSDPTTDDQETVTLPDNAGQVVFTSHYAGKITIKDDGHGSARFTVDPAEPGGHDDSTAWAFRESTGMEAQANDGWEFDYWSTEGGGTLSNVTSATECSLQLSGSAERDHPNITVTAHFKTTLPVHTITVTDDGNGTASANKSEAVSGETVTLTATPASDEWEFAAWVVVTPDGLTIADDAFDMPDGNVEIQATFKKKTDSNPGTDTDPDPDSDPGSDSNPSSDSTDPSSGSDSDGSGSKSGGSSDESKAGTGDARRGYGVLPATGDAVVPIAIGVIAVASIVIGFILYKRNH